MSLAPSPQFFWSDAWILLAAAYAEAQGPATLPRVLSMADGLQHAIPSRPELNGALGRLSRAGYLEDGAPPFVLSAAARALVAEAARGAPSTLAQQDALARLLGAAAWSLAHDPHTADHGEAARIDETAYVAALGVHQASFK